MYVCGECSMICEERCSMRRMDNIRQEKLPEEGKAVLFPYGKVPAGSKVIIYGCGKMGQFFHQEVAATGFCRVVAMVDRNWQDYELLEGVDIIPPESIPDMDFDYVVIASHRKNIISDIYAFLTQELEIGDDKIVAETAFCDLSYVPRHHLSASQMKKGLAFRQKGTLSLAFLVGGGLGDIIMQKKIVTFFSEMIEGSFSMDIYGSEVSAKAVFSDCRGINNYLPPNLYKFNSKKYDVAINAMYIMSLDSARYEKFKGCNMRLHDILQHLEQQLWEWGLKASNDYEMNSIQFGRCRYLKRNAYTAYNEPGGIEIKDSKVEIPLLSEYLARYDELGLKTYITVHYGWGGAEFGRGHAKLWPMAYFEKLVSLLHKRFGGVEVVQLGNETDHRIGGADRYVLGESLEIAKYVLRSSLLHIDCDGGLVHMATQLGTKCAVLFGPTPVWYFGYEENINIVAENCNSCSFLERDFTKCLRRMEKPECMFSIAPEMVFERVEKYLYEALAVS